MKEELKYKEDNFLILLKITVYFLLNAIGVCTGLYGYYMKPFEATRLVVAIGSTIYLVLMGLWTLILQYRIFPSFYRGTNKTTNKSVWIRSTMLFPQAIYQIDLFTPTNSTKMFDSLQVHVEEWIDEDGLIQAEAVVNYLKANLTPKCEKMGKTE